MVYKKSSSVWIFLSLLIVLPDGLYAQCNPPAAPWLGAPQTSSSLTLNWSAVAGATHYQIRYWETAAPGEKTILEDYVTAPFTLDGLRKSTTYTIQLRSICGTTISTWGASASYLTAKSNQTCPAPAGVAVTPGIGMLQVSWTSQGSHGIRYRPGYTGDWLVPSGANNVASSPFIIAGLSAGTYQVEVKQNCATSSSYYTRLTRVVQGGCSTPAEPVVIPDVTSASVILPTVTNVISYTLQYRLGTVGNWQTAGSDIPPSLAYLNPPLTHSSTYQVQIKARCAVGNSQYSPPATFSTLPLASSCLANKDFGKNLSAAQIAQIDEAHNRPSPFPLGSMIAINDGGLNFRSFQNVGYNPITELTTQLRIFHTMDEDFDNSLTNYAENIKPKDTNPEGTPGNTARNKGFYQLYHNTHGFSNITGAVELLQYSPQSWKDKMYKESDWSAAGPSGIKASFENYTKKIIDEFAPPNGSSSQLLMANFQVGNELWDYPVKADYHSLLTGAWSGMVSKYGVKSAGGWKMKFVVGAFQAFRDNTCNDVLRDFSNCSWSLARHDFIGDYLDVSDCSILKDVDAIDCHPYPFWQGTTTWTYPENPASESWQIRNLAGWLAANKDNNSGVLQSTRLWATEYGFDSNQSTGVGERTQSAYLIRGLLMHSRFHFEKVFFYNAFDHSRTTDQYYSGLYNSTGFWKLGTNPNNSAWPSPLEAHGASPKPSWFGMLDLKERFGNHVFYKALVEDAEASVYLLAKPDGSDPYLVFWSPSQTNDANINQNIAIQKNINWASVLPGNYSIETTLAQLFAESNDPGGHFPAALGMATGSTVLSTIRRAPAFIPLHIQTSGNCPAVVTFQRKSHNSPACSSNDNYFEVKLGNVVGSDQITLAGLPLNGINISASSLNGVGFNSASFQDNVQYVDANSLAWIVSPANGVTQTLKLYYCWAQNYLEPASMTTTTSDCSGVVTPCTATQNRSESDDRSQGFPTIMTEPSRFTVQPNPGRDQITMTYLGEPAERASLRVLSSTGQLMSTIIFSDLTDRQQQFIDAKDLPSGLYFLCLQTDRGLQYRSWEKY